MSGGAAALAPAAPETPATTAGGKNAKEPGGGGGPHGLATDGRRPTVPTLVGREGALESSVEAVVADDESPETRVSHESLSSPSSQETRVS